MILDPRGGPLAIIWIIVVVIDIALATKFHWNNLQSIASIIVVFIVGGLLSLAFLMWDKRRFPKD